MENSIYLSGNTADGRQHNKLQWMICLI